MKTVHAWIWNPPPPPPRRLRLPRWAFMAWLFHRRAHPRLALPAL